MIIIMLVITYVLHNYYIILVNYIITQLERSPLDLARSYSKYKVVKILEREEKKLRK